MYSNTSELKSTILIFWTNKEFNTYSGISIAPYRDYIECFQHLTQIPLESITLSTLHSNSLGLFYSLFPVISTRTGHSANWMTIRKKNEAFVALFQPRPTIVKTNLPPTNIFIGFSLVSRVGFWKSVLFFWNIGCLWPRIMQEYMVSGAISAD